MHQLQKTAHQKLRKQQNNSHKRLTLLGRFYTLMEEDFELENPNEEEPKVCESCE